MPPRRAARMLDQARRARLQALAPNRRGSLVRVKRQWVRRARSSPPPNPAVQRVEAHPVDELGRPVDIPDREIAIFTGLERAGLTDNAQRARSFARDTG